MLDIRFSSGIDAWINGRVVVICLMDCSLHIFSEALFSQMNILYSADKILVCENFHKGL